MIGSARCYRIPVSLTNGEQPVRASNDVAISKYQIYTKDNVKFTKDYQQRLRFTDFPGWEDCNMVCLEGASGDTKDRWYWITDRNQSSIANGSVEFAIEFCPTMTLLTGNSSLTGVWSKLPSNLSPWKPQAVMSGAMSDRRRVPFGVEEAYYNDIAYKLMWVSITCTGSISSPTDGGLNTYGFPIAVAKGYGGGYFREGFLDNSEENCHYPRLSVFLSNPAKFGFEVSRIQDISIGGMIPLEYTLADTDNPLVKDLICDGIGVETYTDESGDVYGFGGMMFKEPKIVYNNVYIRKWESPVCNVTIRDQSGIDVFTIPSAWLETFDDTYDCVTLQYQCIVDLGQMYYRLKVNGRIIQLPCGHLPYTGNTWDTYKAYSMSLDRESMQYSINSARDTLNVQTNTAIMNSALNIGTSLLHGDLLGSVTGAMSTAIDVKTNYRLQEISDDATRFTQNLAERRIQAQPSTAYATGYGVSYIYDMLKTGMNVVISLPVGLTQTMFNQYIDRFGYSVEGQAVASCGGGYYQGMILAVHMSRFLEATDLICGEEFDRLAQIYRNGFYMRLIE